MHIAAPSAAKVCSCTSQKQKSKGQLILVVLLIQSFKRELDLPRLIQSPKMAVQPCGQTWQDHNQETMISNSQITNMTKTRKKTWQNVKEKLVTDKSGTPV